MRCFVTPYWMWLFKYEIVNFLINNFRTFWRWPQIRYYWPIGSSVHITNTTSNYRILVYIWYNVQVCLLLRLRISHKRTFSTLVVLFKYIRSTATTTTPCRCHKTNCDGGKAKLSVDSRALKAVYSPQHSLYASLILCQISADAQTVIVCYRPNSTTTGNNITTNLHLLIPTACLTVSLHPTESVGMSTTKVFIVIINHGYFFIFFEL